MRLLNSFIDRLPSSKRSIRDTRSDIHDGNEAVMARINAMQSALEERTRLLSERQENIECRIAEIQSFMSDQFYLSNQRIDTIGAQSTIMQWEIYRKEEESLTDAKKRFFKSMSPASNGMRTLQTGCAQLLHEFDLLCKQHNLHYWIAFGTLLGAVRHNGFIPWDDDVDLGMMRDEIIELMDIVGNDSRYRVSIIYDSWNFCKQVRFMYADIKNPCFLDLFIFEKANTSNHIEFEIMMDCRNRMIEEMRMSDYYEQWHKDEFIAPSHPVANKVKEAFDRYREEYLDLCANEQVDANKSNGILWGIENINDLNHYEWISEETDIFPTVPLIFEKNKVQAPANYWKFLNEVYGDIYSLPKDLVSHCPHVDKKSLLDKSVIEAIEISKKGFVSNAEI